MKKYFYTILAAAAVFSACAKEVIPGGDNTDKPSYKGGAALYGTIIQPNGLGDTKVSIIRDEATRVDLRWDANDQIHINGYKSNGEFGEQWFYAAADGEEVKFTTGNEQTDTTWLQTYGHAFTEPNQGIKRDYDYEAFYYGKNTDYKSAYEVYFKYPYCNTSFSPLTLSCTSDDSNPVRLQNMPMMGTGNNNWTAPGEPRKITFSSNYSLLNVTVPSKLDFDKMYVCVKDESQSLDQNVEFENGSLKDDSKYIVCVADASKLKVGHASDATVSFYIPVKPGDTYEKLTFVATEGEYGTDEHVVARMETYAGKTKSGDTDNDFTHLPELQENTIYYFDFCNTLTIEEEGVYTLTSCNNIDYKVNIAKNITGNVTINAEVEGKEPANIYINNRGHQIDGTLTINASKSHVEGENGIATTVEAKTSNSTFVVKPTLTITGLTVKKGSVVVEGTEENKANVTTITIPEDVTEQIKIDVTGVSSEEETERVKIINESTEATVVVVPNVVGDEQQSYQLEEDSKPVIEATEETVAMIGDTGYETLAAAIGDATAGQTITLVKDVEAAAGISVAEGKNFTVDFGGHTYAMECPGAGSAATQTAGFQLLKNSTITFKNGTIKCTEANKEKTWVKTDASKGIALMIQNYANLTLEDMTIDATNIAHNGVATRYALSNNSGNVEYKGATSIISAAGDYAFDVCKYDTYAEPKVTWNSTGSINGGIELTGGKFVVASNLAVVVPVIAAEGESTLEVTSGKTLSAAADFNDPNPNITNHKSTAPVQVKQGAGLTICGEGTVEGKSTYSAVIVSINGDDDTKTAKLTVDGNVTLLGDYFGIAGNGSRHNTEITVKGGTIKGSHTNDNLGIFHPQGGKLTINGGAIEGYSSAVEVRGGTVAIIAGSLTSTAQTFSCTSSGSGNTTVGAALAIAQHTTRKPIDVKVSGGTFVGYKAVSVEDPENGDPVNVAVAISGGTFSTDPTAFLKEGFSAQQNAQSMWEVNEDKPVAKIGTVGYETLQEAFDAARAAMGGTITLVADVVLAKSINWNGADPSKEAKGDGDITDCSNKYTFDLNGYHVTPKEGTSCNIQVKGCEFNIKDSKGGGYISNPNGLGFCFNANREPYLDNCGVLNIYGGEYIGKNSDPCGQFSHSYGLGSSGETNDGYVCAKIINIYDGEFQGLSCDNARVNIRGGHFTSYIYKGKRDDTNVYKYDKENDAIFIYGGKFDVKGIKLAKEGTFDVIDITKDYCHIYAGDFNFDPTACVEEGSSVKKVDDRWIVTQNN